MLTFYFSPGSSSMAVHIGLHEIGVPFESHVFSFAKHDNMVPEYLALNLEGKVPTIVDDGVTLTEVAAILFYLAKRHPEAKLLPNTALATEAQAISWMSFIASTLHPARARGPEHSMRVFGIADQRLGVREWALGGYSIVDIHLFRLFWRFRGSFNPSPETYPNLERHYARMMARPAVIRTIEIESAIGYNLPA